MRGVKKVANHNIEVGEGGGGEKGEIPGKDLQNPSKEKIRARIGRTPVRKGTG